jgi:hypothetical protein
MLARFAYASSALLFLRHSSRSRVHGCRDRASHASRRPGVAVRDSEGGVAARLCVPFVREAWCVVCEESTSALVRAGLGVVVARNGPCRAIELHIEIGVSAASNNTLHLIYD